MKPYPSPQKISRVGGLAKAGAADNGFMLSSQGKASKALPEVRKFRRDGKDEVLSFFIRFILFEKVHFGQGCESVILPESHP